MARQATSMKKTRACYSQTYKGEALALADRVGASAAARELGLQPSQLYQWRAQSQQQSSVSHGGHNIPLKDIQRRFLRSLSNLLTLYAPSVTRARCFMNAGGTPEPVFEQTGSQRLILDDRHFNAIVKEARP